MYYGTNDCRCPNCGSVHSSVTITHISNTKFYADAPTKTSLTALPQQKRFDLVLNARAEAVQSARPPAKRDEQRPSQRRPHGQGQARR